MFHLNISKCFHHNSLVRSELEDLFSSYYSQSNKFLKEFTNFFYRKTRDCQLKSNFIKNPVPIICLEVINFASLSDKCQKSHKNNQNHKNSSFF